MMRKIGKAQKKGITFAVVCCVLLAMVFSANLKNLFALAADALNDLIGTEAAAESTMVVMKIDDAVQTEDYIAFGVYAPSTATYTIGATAENGSVRVNTGEAIAVDGDEISVALTEGTNVLYFMNCDNPLIQWNPITCDLAPVNKVSMFLAGDVDQSKGRTVADLVRIKRESALSGDGDIERTEIADIDGNNSITGEDARLFRTLMVGNPGYEAAEQKPVIVDAYIEKTETLYDTLAEAMSAASEMSVSTSEPVTVTVLNPSDVKLTERILVQDGAQIILQDDGTKNSGWSRTITRDSALKKEMFAVGDAVLTLTGSSESDEYSSFILDGGAIPASSNHFVDVGNAISSTTATLTMNAGVKLTNNVNSDAKSSGGALAIKGTFNMNGGIISENMAAGVGGAINLLANSTMTMKGGTITENETKAELYSGGGVSVSGNATLIMEGGAIYGNIAPICLDSNSVRVSKNSVLKMEGDAYIDRVCIDATFSSTPCIELTGALTTDKDITLFSTQPLNQINAVVKGSAYYSASNAKFVFSERMLPCKLVEVDDADSLYLRSNLEGMEKVTAELVYSNENAFSGINNEWVVQGACSDGTYLYAAIAHNVDGAHKGCRILKVNTETWEQVAISEELPTDHSNELTYNPTTGKIYVTHCESSGEFEGTTGINEDNGSYFISVVNPSNLNEVESTIQLSNATTYTGKTGTYALAYNETQKYYVAGGTGFRFGFLKDDKDDNDKDTIIETAMPSTGMSGFIGYTGYIKQGIYANDTTIYTNTWYDISNEEKNFITMYDWSGNYNGTKYVVNKDGTEFTREGESMFECNGKMYMACFPESHTGVEIYELSSVGTVTSTIDVLGTDGTPVDGVYTNLSDAIKKANTLESATIVLKDDVTIGETQIIQGNITIRDDGTQRILQRSAGCTGEMFNVAADATLTFISTSEDDSNPKLVIDGNKDNVQIPDKTYAPVVDMGQTNGILNIYPGVIIRNNKSGNTGGVILAGANKSNSTGGGLATISIKGGLFAGNEVAYSSTYLFGGCIYIEAGCTLNISDATFEDTAMAASGGTVYGGVISVRTNKAQQYADDGANVTIDNCIFRNTDVTQKTTTYGGGAIYVGDGNKGNVQINNCEFTNNSIEGVGGAIDMRNTNTALVLSGCTFSGNTDKTGANDIYMAASTKINVSGDTKANIKCAGTDQIHIAGNLGTESVLNVTMSNNTVGTKVATFASEDIMNVCKANRNIVLSDANYVLSYDATNNQATLENAAAVVGNSGYATFAEAIAVANALENATIVLKANVTVSAPQTITGNVTITDDGTARTIIRADEFTERMFVVENGAGLTFAATSEDKDNHSLIVDGNGKTSGASKAIVSLGSGNGTFTVNNAVQFKNANINEEGGIIRTEDGSTAIVTINGGAFETNTAEIAGDVYGGLIKVVGTVKMTISDALFQDNIVKTTTGALRGGIIYVGGGTVNIVGSTFTSNEFYTKSAGAGGVIAAYGGTINVGKYVNDANVIVHGDCSFTENIFTGNSYGGAIAISDESANVSIYNTTIQRNEAKQGGGVHLGGDTTLTVGDCTVTENTTVNNGSARLDINANGTVNLGGTVKATIFCQNPVSLFVTTQLEAESEIKVGVLESKISEGDTVVTFKSAEIMAASREYITYATYSASGYTESTQYTLNYETTSDSKYVAKLKTKE